MLIRFWVLCFACLLELITGDWLNEYLNQKVFGDNPGPCPTQAEACLVERSDGGTIEIWELVCREISIEDLVLPVVNGGQNQAFITARAIATNIFQNCNGKTKFIDVTFQSPLGDVLVSGEGTFTTRQNAGGASGSFEIDFLAPSGNSFLTETPETVQIPFSKCNLDLNLAFELQLNGGRLEDLEVCIGFLGCADISGWPGIGNDFVNRILRGFDETYSEVVCESLTELAYVKDDNDSGELGTPPGTVGSLNEYISMLNNELDNLRTGQPENINTVENAITNGLYPYISQADIQKSLNWATDPNLELFSNYWNDVLISTNENGELFINEIINSFTSDGEFLMDFVESGIDLSFQFDAGTASFDIKLEEVRLEKLNKVKAFEIFQNNYDQLPGSRRQFTPTHRFELDEVKATIKVSVALSRGTWVSASSCSSGSGGFTPSCTSDITSFSFYYEVDLSDVTLDMSTTMLLDSQKLLKIQLGTLFDPYRDEVSLESLKDLLRCISPAFYALNFTSLELNVGSVSSLDAFGFSDPAFSQFISDMNNLGNILMREAIRRALPAISQGVVRRRVNEFIIAEIENPVNTCVPYNPSTLSPYVVFNTGIAAEAYTVINTEVGGDPVTTETPNINTIFQSVLELLAERETGSFPLKQGLQDGNWIAKDEFQTDLMFAAFSPLGAFANLGYPFILENTNELSKFTVTPFGLFGIDIAAGYDKNIPQTGPDPLKFALTIEVMNGDLNIDEEFTLEIILNDLDLDIGIRDIRVRGSNLLRLEIGQLIIVPCLIATVEDFRIPISSLSVGSFDTSMTRTKQQSGNFFYNAITALEQELIQPPVTKTSAMFNTILDRTLALVVQSIEETDTSQYDLSNCESQGTTFPLIDLYAGFDVPSNLSSIWEECSAVPAPVLTPLQAETLVQYDPLVDSYLDLSTSSVIEYISGFLNSELLEANDPANVLDFVDYFLVNAANDPENTFYELLSLRTDNGEDIVDLIINLNDQGSFVQSLFDTDFVFEDGRIIPGFRVQANEFKVSRLNKLLTEFKLLQPVSRFVTSNRVTFSSGEPLVVELTGSYEYYASFIGDSNSPNRKISQSFSVELDLTGLDIDFDLLLAINTEQLSSLALGHLFQVTSPNQELVPSPTIISCILSTVFAGGISISRLSVNVDSLPLTPFRVDLGSSVSSVPEQDRAISPGVEQVLQESMNLAVNFYIDAIPNICQNCLRDHINEDLKQRALDARSGECPVTFEPNPELLQEDRILRFNTIPLMNDFQKLLDAIWTSNGTFAPLNDLVRDATSNEAVFFRDDPINLLFQQPLKLNNVTFGRATVQLQDFSFSDFDTITDAACLEPVSNNDGYNDAYTTISRLKVDGPVDIKFIVKFIAYDVFEADDEMINEVELTFTVQNLEILLMLYAEIDLNDAFTIPLGGVTTLNPGCYIRPTVDFQILDYLCNFGTLDIKLTCGGICEFPAFESLKTGLSIVSPDGEAFSNAVKDFANYVEEYIVSEDFQDYVEYLRENGEEICANESTVVGVLETETSDFGEFANLLAYSFVGLTIGAVMLFFGARPVHRSRQAFMLRKRGFEENSTNNYVYHSLSSLATHPTTSLVTKTLVPLLIIGNLCALVYAFFFVGALDITFQFELFGAETKQIVVVPFSVAATVNRLYAEGFIISALLIGYTAFGFPVVLYLSLGGVWYIPATIISRNNRYNFIVYLLSQEKWMFLPVFVLVLTLAALRTYVRDITYSQIAFLDPSYLQGEVNVVPKFGILLLCVVATFAILLTQVFGVHQYRAQQWDRLKKEKYELSLMGQRKVLQRRRLGPYERPHQHIFKSVNFVFVQKKVYAVILLSVLSFLLVLIGAFVPVITYEVQGLVGEVLEALDTPLDVKTYSLISLGQLISEASATDFIETLTRSFVQTFFIVTTLILPLTITPMVLFLWFQRFTIRTRRVVLGFVSSAWACSALEVIIIAMFLSLFGVESVAVSSVSFLSDSLCQFAKGILKESLGENVTGAEVICFDLDAKIEGSATFLVIGLLLQLVTTTILMVTITTVVKDQEFVARTQNKEPGIPVKIGPVRTLVLRCMGNVLPTEIDNQSTVSEDDHFQFGTLGVLGAMALNLRNSVAVAMRPRTWSGSGSESGRGLGLMARLRGTSFSNLLSGGSFSADVDPERDSDRDRDRSSSVVSNVSFFNRILKRPVTVRIGVPIDLQKSQDGNLDYSLQRPPPPASTPPPPNYSQSPERPQRPPPLSLDARRQQQYRRKENPSPSLPKLTPKAQTTGNAAANPKSSPVRPARPSNAAIKSASSRMKNPLLASPRTNASSHSTNQNSSSASREQQSRSPKPKLEGGATTKPESKKKKKRVSESLDDWLQTLPRSKANNRKDKDTGDDNASLPPI